ncbi:lipoprotein [Paraburkholderia sp. BL10I2N1]|uniref:LPS translocon maturation chaperone LptM n=1 Tax=Paraburkholderia sp. BL10I2N1 TaxID=1938796 RepID=UPI00106239FB|nr:lipoprotein [Paraburkholderia sp. BL10I2N1]
MRVVFRMSAIVAALAILAGAALGGCGQRGALYLPTVPPLPPKPSAQTQPASPNEVPGTASDAAPASAAVFGTVPDTSGNALSLSPDTELRTTPGSGETPSTVHPASGASTDQ